MADFKLSAALQGHDDDVRSVVFPQANALISASRDATVRVWNQTSSTPPAYDASIAQQGSEFINVVTFIPPTDGFPEGLIVSGGKDAIIEVRQPNKPPEDNAERLLIGHTSNVCALDVWTGGELPYLVSGGWDSQARIWPIGNWDNSSVLAEHEGAVWAVLAYNSDTIITGCADTKIRVFTVAGKLVRTFPGSSEVIRALCKLPEKTKTGANFASAGNDTVIRLWNLQGQLLGQIQGHDNFIYSLALLPGGEIVSSSEDRTVRIWKDQRCVQTITHPAISVWSVAACAENGDIVSGASDKIIRVFSRSQERQASPEAIQQFDESVKASSIPQQQMGDINKEKLPGPEFLQQKLGTKEGQVQMIREDNGNVSAYQWSASANEWINVGTVVDGVGSSGKKQEYAGQDYDYVFDVDIEEGKPPLKLPYNLSQNPYEVARNFIATNELPITYLDQVANFIVTNTQGATIGQTSSGGPESSFPEPQAAPTRPKILPQKEYLSITAANLAPISAKIAQLNQQILSSGQKHLTFNDGDLAIMPSFTKSLDIALKALPASSPPSSDSGIAKGLQLVLKIITTWPPESRLPGLDLFRLLAAVDPSLATTHDPFSLLDQSGAFASDASPNNTMLAIRALANLFQHDAGRALALAHLDAVRARLAPYAAAPAPVNRNVQIALATVYINYGVLASADGSAVVEDQAAQLLDDVVAFVGSKAVTDSEVVYRALVAAGTLLSAPQVGALDAARRERVEQVVAGVLKTAKEPRIKAVCTEVRERLKP